MKDKIIKEKLEKFKFDTLEIKDLKRIYSFSEELIDEYFLKEKNLSKNWDKGKCEICGKSINVLDNDFVCSIWERVRKDFSRNIILCSWDCLDKLKFKKLKNKEVRK